MKIRSRADNGKTEGRLRFVGQVNIQNGLQKFSEQGSELSFQRDVPHINQECEPPKP